MHVRTNPRGAVHTMNQMAVFTILPPEIQPAKFQKLAAAGLRKIVRRTDMVAVKHQVRDEDGFLVLLLVMLVVAPS